MTASISETAAKLANSLLVLTTAAALDRPELGRGVIVRMRELLTDGRRQLEPFAAAGEVGATVAVGGCHYPSAHHAVFSQAELFCEVLRRLADESDWGCTKAAVAEWLSPEWQDEFRAVAARLAREAAITAPERDTGDEAADNPPAAVHSPDFRSVNWFGKQYPFTGNQAAAVRLLWEAWQSGAPDVGGETLIQAADASTQRIDVVFRGNPAWGAMIVQGGTRGSYRLTEPAVNSSKAGKRKRKSASTRK